jgi:hypothetical protein
MATSYTDVVFSNLGQGGITATKLNKLRDDLSSAIAAGGGGGGTGDMTKAVYDTNNNGKVDTCDSVPWGSVTGVPGTFAPSPHQASHVSGADQIPTTSTAVRGLAPKLNGSATSYLDGTGVFSTPPSGTGVNAFTVTVTSPFTVPAVGSSTTATVADASWIVVGQLLYVDTAGGGPGLAGALVVQAKAGNTLTLLNPLPPPSTGSSTPHGVWGETPSGTIDGSNKNYTSAQPYSPTTLAVFLNGLRMRRSGDYTETGSNSFSFVTAPLPGDSLSIDYMQP